jgi:hypothetical protein
MKRLGRLTVAGVKPHARRRRYCDRVMLEMMEAWSAKVMSLS